jgi:D-alanyl-D-alanine carboxypeptidase (penicillin-binding protein 5/6)
MTKRNILIIISVLSLIGFIFVLGASISKKGNNNGSIFANVDLEKKKIEENVKKYQPQKVGKTKENTIDISAKSAIVVDENTNEILYQKDSNSQLPPASITKIATISVALENLRKDDLIEISQKASDQVANKIVMKAGEKMSLSDLLYGLMMISANDAAFAIAESVPGGYDGFIRLMNDKVRMLGLSNTIFKNPSGLDEEGHYSSAFDIATLTRYALLSHPSVVEYAGKKEDHSVYATDRNESHWWGHISGMLYRYPGMIAAKTGYTEEAGSTFIGIAERDGRRLVVVFLGATDANSDVTKLLDYGFSN